MIKIWKHNAGSLHQTAILERNCWLQVTDPGELEIDSLVREYGIERDVILDVLDTDERSRFEKSHNFTLIIYRIPLKGDDAVPYRTVPIGIILIDGLIITIGAKEPEVFERMQSRPAEGYSLDDPGSFVRRVMTHTAADYLRFLKEINRKTTCIEQDLQKSIRNHELIQLLDMEKALVFFTTSLKSNELVIEKMRKGVWKNLAGDEADIMEDIVTENQQAIEMASIYSNILSGMMDAFASVISNNLNSVMKRLTMISIALMIPTLFASLYGMNLAHLPFSASRFAFPAIAFISVVAAILGTWIFSRIGKLK